MVMFRRQTEVFPAKRTDDKARLNAEHFHQSISHQPGAANQRSTLILLALAGVYDNARCVFFQAADFGVVNNLAAFGLENSRHRGGDVAVADNPA
ncbi:hypothetical protein D3C73_1229480 [compost metagenome]